MPISFAHLLSIFSVTFAFNAEAKISESKTPVRIRSDVIDIKQKYSSIEFIKNVVVDKDKSSLVADRMTVSYRLKKDKQKEDGQKSEIKQIDAIGNVKIFSDEFVASGNYGNYNPKTNSFTLKENVIVNNGTSIASGEEFIYIISSKKGEFIGKKRDLKNKNFLSQSQKNQIKSESQKLQNKQENEDDRITVIINEEVESKNQKPRKHKSNF